MKRLTIICIFLLCFCLSTQAQILEVTPAFPNKFDNISLVYNASEGNGALQGINQIYVHTGLITSESTTPNDWKYVVSEWGVADPDFLMQYVGNNQHLLELNIQDFYSVAEDEEVLKLAFVFRNADGSIVGRASDGSDIYYDIYAEDVAFEAKFLKPDENFFIAEVGETYEFRAASTEEANFSINDNGNNIYEISDVKDFEFDLTVETDGIHLLELIADNGSEVKKDSIYYTISPEVITEEPPYDYENGITIIDENSVFLQLYAPYKSFVYVLGDFNDWQPHPDYFMKRAANGSTWWLEVEGLSPDEQYAFQYWVDGEIRIADPFSTLVADSWNDALISEEIYPNAHPTHNFNGRASLFSTDNNEFDWQVNNFEKPEKTDLVIYELLIRDFIEDHSYLTLIDSLDYLESLGINAVELMPVSEFENNESWGYNTSFPMALDKYYGTPEHFKMFIDECHSRGIAVIMDIVFNHAYGQNPLVQLYWNAANNQPAAISPYFNEECPHPPYCWGYDFNHEKQPVKDFVDQVCKYWVEEFKIDGFRFDFTKGMTNSSNGEYDQFRIDNLKRIGDNIWNIDEEAFLILEHFTGNNEEKTLAEYGFLIWGNTTYAYQEGAMGYLGGSNFEYGLYNQRNWDVPHLVSYMESHDEERIMYKCLQYGNDNENYNIKDLNIALQRAELNACMYFTQPGPKMIWQFGEMGYDISIDYGCRVCNKPILWNYLEQQNRKRLKEVYASLIHLKQEYAVFKTNDFYWNYAGSNKSLNLEGEEFDVVVLGNYDLEAKDFAPSFSQIGWWYEYFTGDSVYIDYPLELPQFEAGEYRIYTSEQLTTPDITPFTSIDEILNETDLELSIFPNPSTDFISLAFNGDGRNYSIEIIDITGSVIKAIMDNNYLTGKQLVETDISELSNGQYFFIIRNDDKIGAFEFMKQ